MVGVRGAVVSVRISTADQERLRRIAESRGTSVSDLVRSAALREAGYSSPQAVTSTTAPASRATEIGRGLIWNVPPGVEVVGNTFIY